jgi:hypothetical protein
VSLAPIPTDPHVTDPHGKVLPTYQSWFASIQRWLSPVGQVGTTAQRPTKNLYVGQSYLDQSLNKPIWVKAVSPAIVWMDATGGIV